MRVSGPTGRQVLDASPCVAELETQIIQLRAALESRDVIGQAKGIVRFLTHRDSESAFALLSQMSQDTNRKVREVAAVVADCAASGRPLPPDLSTSWRTHTAAQPNSP